MAIPINRNSMTLQDYFDGLLHPLEELATLFTNSNQHGEAALVNAFTYYLQSNTGILAHLLEEATGKNIIVKTARNPQDAHEVQLLDFGVPYA